MLEGLPTFALTALLLAMVPGQGTAMLLRQAILGGKRIALISALGTVAGLLTWALLSAVGVSTIFAQSKIAYLSLKWVGALYLLYLSITTILQARKPGTLLFSTGNFSVKRPLTAFRVGYFTNMTNVKAAIFSIAFYPRFIPENYPIIKGILILGAVQSCVSFFCAGTLTTVIVRSSAALNSERARRVLTLISGLGILVLAFSLILSA